MLLSKDVGSLCSVETDCVSEKVGDNTSTFSAEQFGGVFCDIDPCMSTIFPPGVIGVVDRWLARSVCTGFVVGGDRISSESENTLIL